MLDKTTSMSNSVKMRTEITTLTQFGAIGTFEDVAKKYDVSKSTAYACMKKLHQKAKGEKTTNPTLTEVEKFHADVEVQPLPKVEMDKVVEIQPEGQEGAVETLEDSGVDDCPKIHLEEAEKVISETSDCFGSFDVLDERCRFNHYHNKEACKVVKNNPPEETAEVLADLVEAEPAWPPKYAGETLGPLQTGTNPRWQLNGEELGKLKQALDRLETPEDDEEMWVFIKDQLKGLKSRMIERAEVEFSNRAARLLEAL